MNAEAAVIGDNFVNYSPWEGIYSVENYLLSKIPFLYLNILTELEVMIKKLEPTVFYDAGHLMNDRLAY